MEYLLKKLNSNGGRPIFRTTSGSGVDITCLLDTGADIPVFTLGVESLLLHYPEAEEVQNLCVVLHGFGKEPEIVPVYKIPNFKIIGSNNAVIEYAILHVACTERSDIGVTMILSATMFSQMNYTIHNIGIDSSRLEIEYNDRLFYTGVRRLTGNEEILNDFKKKYGGVPVDVVYSFTQSEQDSSQPLDRVAQMEAEIQQALADLE